MTQRPKNPCIRCGSERIVTKTWEEPWGNSTITNREFTCPDPSCQTKVDTDNKKNNDKHIALRMRSEERAVQRRAAKVAEKDEKAANAKSAIDNT